MPARSKITQLPPEIKAELDKRLIEGSFAGYDDLAEWLNGQLTTLGLEVSISRSAVHRYGQGFEEKMMAIKIATEQAKAICGTVGDDEGQMNEALIRLVQQQAFDVLVNMQSEDPDTFAKIFPKMGVMVAKLSKASVDQKKWALEARKKALNDAADVVEEVAKQQGMNADQARFWREQVLGVK